MNGILLIDKPADWTSFDVVAKVRGIVRQATGAKRPKVGHAGTLDPLATGLLVVLVGDYCKRAQEFSKLDKVYQVGMRLGAVSTTDDTEGELSQVSHHKPAQQEVIDAIHSFEGEIQQIPPIYSAIKVDGQRAYKLARAGKAPEMQARPVRIYRIDEIVYSYPNITFLTEVSSGTYIRSLVRDIGEKLGTGAYMTSLSRTRVGDFELADAQQIDALTPDNISARLA